MKFVENQLKSVIDPGLLNPDLNAELEFQQQRELEGLG